MTNSKNYDIIYTDEQRQGRHTMKRFENELVKPFEKFAWDNDKSRLAIKLPLKAVENPLLLYVMLYNKT